MIEETVVDYLDDVLEEPAYPETPEEPPEQYVLVQKTGSRKKNHIYSATLAVQSIAGSIYAAAELNEKVKEAMDRITVLDEVCRSALNSDYEYSDTARKEYRYQAVYDLVHY